MKESTKPEAAPQPSAAKPARKTARKTPATPPPARPGNGKLYGVGGDEPGKVERSDPDAFAEFSAPEPPAVDVDDLLAELRADPDDNETDTAVTKPIVTVAIRKPRANEFVRASRDPAYVVPAAWFVAHAIGKNTLDELFMVHPSMQQLLGKGVFKASLVLAINRAGEPFLWLLKLPRGDGHNFGGTWNESGRACAEMAKDKWLKVDSNMAEQRYDPLPAKTTFPDPVWPTLTLNELLKKALPEGKLIRDTNHIVFRLREGME